MDPVTDSGRPPGGVPVTAPSAPATPAGSGGRYGSIADVEGVAVGHAQRSGGGWLSGVTVVLPPPGTTGAVDVRGGGPGTHETDALDPTTLVPTVDAVCLTGGSAYGLAAAGGVQAWCEEQGRGFAAGPPRNRRGLLVPIVPAAAVFDLGRGGDPRARPDAALGHAAASQTRAAEGVRCGCVGAGTGALLAAGQLKGGVGTASVRLPGDLVVGALAVVNAAGSPADPVTGALLGTAFVPPGRPRPLRPIPDQARALAERLAPVASPAGGGVNTTLAVVATNAVLDPARTRRMATSAHDGLARSLNPVHTLYDGDTVFALATGRTAVDEGVVARLHAAAADAVLLAVLDAVLDATAIRTPAVDVPAYLDVCPTALPS
jgi:L-aminopeptidase/D-esterase-like protein